MSDYSTCPYRDIPPRQRWDAAVGSVAREDIDPGVIGNRSLLSAGSRIATAGSCFAQRISETLRHVGYGFLDVEPPPRWLSAAKQATFGYGLFSARYGNIYTALQLTQLIQRAFDLTEMSDEIWSGEGRYFDPFRPRITPNGYASLEELKADSQNHLKAVRTMFETLDVFVFTLGLTEAWLRSSDGAVLPVCPGCGIGQFEPDKYAFKNFDIHETVSQISSFVAILKSVNPNARVILTVSPVPLIATMEDRNIILSTSYSKSVLRVAAQMLTNEFDHISYFPSFEIITQTFNNDAYFDADRRSVNSRGVDHVMKCFFRNFFDVDIGELQVPRGVGGEPSFGNVVCDEEALAVALAEQQARAN